MAAGRRVTLEEVASRLLLEATGRVEHEPARDAVEDRSVVGTAHSTSPCDHSTFV
jgi:hypothetical protein